MAFRESYIGRREFLKSGLVAGLTATNPSLFRAAKGQKKPNILLIMSDEHKSADFELLWEHDH